ncbi:MAG: NAD-dependent epimerase/dehydratase family protein [bacterium]
MKKTILICGGAGFIGHSIVKELAPIGHKIIIYDNFSNYIPPKEGHYPFYLQKRLEQIKNCAEIVRGDIRDKDCLIKTIKRTKPEIVINLIAIPLATASNEFFEDAIQINLNGHINLLEAMRTVNSVERILYASSSFVYGHFQYDPADEKHSTKPIDIYGGTKLSCEMLTEVYGKRFGIDYTIIRPSAVYGPTDSNRRVSQIFVEKALAGEPLALYGGGKDKVDFTYITDAAHGFVLAALSDKGKNEIFNITAGLGRSAEDFAQLLDQFIPDKVKTIVKPADMNRPIRGSLDITKAKNILNYEPKYQLEQGLKEYIEYINSTGLFKR